MLSSSTLRHRFLLLTWSKKLAWWNWVALFTTRVQLSVALSTCAACSGHRSQAAGAHNDSQVHTRRKAHNKSHSAHNEEGKGVHCLVHFAVLPSTNSLHPKCTQREGVTNKQARRSVLLGTQCVQLHSIEHKHSLLRWEVSAVMEYDTTSSPENPQEILDCCVRFRLKTLPEAQRTQGIASLTWVISPAKN